MPDNRATKEVVYDILSKGDALMRAAFQPDGTLIDVVQARDRNTDEVENPVDTAVFLDIVMSFLGHVSVNPSNSAITEFIVKSYVYPTGSEGSHGGITTVNQTEENAKDFLDRLIRAARREKAKSLSTTDPESAIDKQYPYYNRTFTLTGDRGVGKSYFLNLLVSRFTSYLDQESTVWVRINLVAEYGFDRDMQGWMQAQIAKILLRYYERTSDYARKSAELTHDFYAHLCDWIESSKDIPEGHRSTLNEQLLRMYTAFCKNDSDENISPTLCTATICQELFRYARRNCDLSFIVVFDGFDRLDRDALHRTRFNNLNEHVSRFIESKTSPGAAIVLVSRHRTFESLVGQDPYRHLTAQRYQVGTPHFDEILLKRLQVIEDHLETELFPQHEALDQTKVLNTVRDFRSMLLSRHIDSREYNELMTSLAFNNRAKCQVIQLFFQEFCQTKGKDGYRLIEHMVKASFVFPPVIYRYHQEQDQIYASSAPDYIYDSRFLPLVTRPPIPISSTKKNEVDRTLYDSTSILIGVRILQLLRLWRDRIHRGESSEPLTVREVVDTLHCLFGYSPSIVRSTIYEFECFESIEIEHHSAFEKDSEFDRLTILTKGDHIIDRFLPEISYLNFCGMRLLASSKFFEGSELLKAAALRGPNYKTVPRKSRYRRWIRAKIMNSLTTAAILLAVNRAQEQTADTWKPNDLPDRLQDNWRELATLFAAFEDWPRRIAADIARIESGTAGQYFANNELNAFLLEMQKRVDAIP